MRTQACHEVPTSYVALAPVLQEDWLSPEGFLFDLVVARPPREQQQQQGGGDDPAQGSVIHQETCGMPISRQEQSWLPATCWVVQLVAPSQFKAGGETPASSNSSGKTQLPPQALRLQQAVPPCRGRLTGQLKGQLRNAAAGQLALYVRSQWRVVLVPFQELWAPGAAADAAAGQDRPPQLLDVDAAAAYLENLLADQGQF
jgi:hypothetical protein